MSAGFGLYIHWPFCLAKCPYCDFNSHVRDRIDARRWRDALIAELDRFAVETAGRTLTSIFFGGGTPSLMDPATVAALIERALARWQVAPDIEITLEANPTSIEAGRFTAFRAGGVNRVSIGVQSLDPQALRFLGRQHDADQARAALGLAHKIFDRVSFDLIYARPGQSEPAWRAELSEALSLAGEHLSLYQLTIEPDTGFAGRVRRGEFAPMAGDDAAALYELTGAMMESHGRPAYEISNYARPGREARHNLTYWRYGDYVGVGPGAHGRLTLDGIKVATRQHRAPETWLGAVEHQGSGTLERSPIAQDARRDELFLMGLRLSEGVSEGRVREELGCTIEEALDGADLARFIEAGFLIRDGKGLRASAAGRLRLDALLGAILRQAAPLR